MKKIFVLDTNVLIHNPRALFSFQDNRVVVPMTVIEEIDDFKKGLDEKGRNARQIGRYLDELREHGSLKDGVTTENGNLIQVVLFKKDEDVLQNFQLNDKNDNLIIGTALLMQKQFPDALVTMNSKDANVRIKSDAVGLKAQNYNNDKIEFSELYTGMSDLIISDEKIIQFEKEKFLTNEFGDFYPNQYIKLISKENDQKHYFSRYSKKNNSLYSLTHKKNDTIFGIEARNIEQVLALDLLMDPTIRLVSLVGIAGTGKTLLAMAAGLEQVIEQDIYSKLIISRPIFPLGKDLGFLPGTKSEKFNPWMQPIYDNMNILIHGHEDVKTNKNDRKNFTKKSVSLDDYLDFGYIELEPLTYIRGRSLPNQFIIIDEAQNLTPHEMKTIITRAGEDTKIVLTGDPYQIDIPYLDSQSNGLSRAVEKLKTEHIVGHITLKKGERSKLADIAAKYF